MVSARKHFPEPNPGNPSVNDATSVRATPVQPEALTALVDLLAAALIGPLTEAVVARLAAPPPTRLVPRKEAARCLGISETTLVEHTQAGRIREVILGARHLIPVSEIERIAAGESR